MKPPMPPPTMIKITEATARKKLGLPEEPEVVHFPEEEKKETTAPTAPKPQTQPRPDSGGEE